ncbi:hypothetical protein IDM40_05310 [Nocardiopsis sp. HNM0947]|uniref:Uncharacterized protein n=1 Tax=Nocardiopsis coralli TaxID=2772213 RepID=A0ABR9P2R8_9ACTN|nr:hypothetical protein [Nocardiopsis coralli]MBE2998126.1 hypothetical protein [Nocardiopsis coralli]
MSQPLPPRPSQQGRPPGLPWALVLGLGALALVRPLLSIVGVTEAVGGAIVQPLVTVLITAVWVGTVVAVREPRPVATLVLTGLTYALASVVLSAVLSPVLSGELQGPLANPVALVPMAATNALWGLVAGLIALGAGSALRTRHRVT